MTVARAVFVCSVVLYLCHSLARRVILRIR